MKIVTRALIGRALPKASPALLDSLLASAGDFEAIGVTNGRRFAGLFATIHVETGGGRSLEESFAYSDPDRLRQTFGVFKRGEADPRQYVYDKTKPYEPQARRLANLVYSNRRDLGNRGGDDGWNYRGSGPIQTTGLDNFTHAAKRLGVDCVANPGILRDVRLAGKITALEWRARNLNALCDARNLPAVRKGVNGGSNGLADFQREFARILRLVGDGPISWGATDKEPMIPQPVIPASPVVAPAPQASDVYAGIVDGVFDRRVLTVQTLLWNRNYKTVGKRDGKMGRNTRAAIVAFREDAGLPLTPAIDAELVTALSAAAPAEIAPERAEATTKEIAKAVPSFRQTARAKLLALFTGGAAVVNQGVTYLTTPGSLDTVKGTVGAARGWAQDLGWGVWAVSTVAVLAGVGAVWWYSRKSEEHQAEGYRAGEIMGQ